MENPETAEKGILPQRKKQTNGTIDRTTRAPPMVPNFFLIFADVPVPAHVRRSRPTLSANS